MRNNRLFQNALRTADQTCIPQVNPQTTRTMLVTQNQSPKTIFGEHSLLQGKHSTGKGTRSQLPY